MKTSAVTVNSTATLLVAPDNKDRIVYLHSGTGSVYVGGSDVTASTGIHLPNGTTIQMTIPFNESVYGVTSAATQTMRILTPDID